MVNNFNDAFQKQNFVRQNLEIFSALDEIIKKPDHRPLIEPHSPLSSDRENGQAGEKKKDYSHDGVYEQHGELSEEDEVVF